MGNPTNHAPNSKPTSSTPHDTDNASLSHPTPAATTSSSLASSLPSEAIDLAAELFDLARTGQDHILLNYVAAGVPANMTNASGDTLLMLASYHGHADTVAGLLDAGADPDCLNDRGQSPLAGAVFKGYEEVVRVLVEKGHANAETGQPTAIQTARMFRRGECLRIMGVNPDDVDAEPLPGMIPGGQQ